MKNRALLSLLFVLGGLLGLVGCVGTEPEARSTSRQTEQTDQENRSLNNLPPHHFIRRGMSVDRVKSLVGNPEEKEQKVGQTEVWQYSFGIVMVNRGTVQYKYPPTERQEKERIRQLETNR